MHAELCGAIPALVGLEDAARLAIADQHVATLSLPAAIRYVRGILRNEIDKTMESSKMRSPISTGRTSPHG
jgi:hypothetical protein